MRRIEIIRGIVGIVLFVIAVIVIANSALKKQKETGITIELYTCYAQGIEEQEEKVLLEDKQKVKESKKIIFDNVEYSTIRSKEELHKPIHLPYAVAEYEAESGELFSVDVETGDIIEYISGDSTKKGIDISDEERERIARKYASEIRSVDNYKMECREMNGYYTYDFIKYVSRFKTTDEIKVILLGDGTLYMFCYYTIGEFDELDKMYEIDKENYYNRGPVLDKVMVDKAVSEKVKKQFGDTVTYEEKDMTIVKKRNGEFAVLVIVDVSDDKGELIAVREKYYVTWE